MYVAPHGCVRRGLCGLLAILLVVGPMLPAATLRAQEGIIQRKGIVQEISSNSDRLDMTVSTSQILTLGSRIPRIQVNNPDLLGVTALSATEIQVAAKKVGVTQINLWDEEGNIYSVDVTILGDARELELALRTQFPNSSIKVYRYSNALVLKGFVDRPDFVSQIMRLAEDYAPKVINNISVGGVHEVMLRVKVMEVSRTKLRQLGFDFAQISSSGAFVGSTISGLLSAVDSGGATATGLDTFRFGITNGGDVFFGLLDALEENRIGKILAEPVLTTVSGRPAQFNVGGEFPVLVPQSLGTVSIEYKKFGTQVDFLPIVLGNGNIRLEVRPRVTELDPSLDVTLPNSNISIPGLRSREIDTGVEMKAGQTLALAGLIQQRTEAIKRGLPFVSDLPYLGVPFRRVEERTNEIELLILVTPEFVDAMDPHEVPPCGPGMYTQSPTNGELYFQGYLEVPRCGIDGACGPNGCPTPGAPVQGDGAMFYGPADNGTTLPADAGGPAFETVPPGSETGPEPPIPPTDQGAGSSTYRDLMSGRFAPLNSSSVTPTTGSTSYRSLRSASFVRDNAYRAPDQPPGPVGPVGYDVSE